MTKFGREDISVWRDEDNLLHIQVGDQYNNFSITNDDDDVLSAVDLLTETLMRKIVGVTSHDFIMKVNDFFMKEQDND